MILTIILGLGSLIAGAFLLMVCLGIAFGLADMQKIAKPGLLEIVVSVGVFVIVTIILSLVGLTWWLICIGAVFMFIIYKIGQRALSDPNLGA